MCLFSVIFQTLPGCPVLVLANREEDVARPSSEPSVNHAADSLGDWLGGRDLVAGGTWLGVNRSGMLVALTNRPKDYDPETVTSRGLLCRSILESGSIENAQTELARQWEQHTFAGFNLILMNREHGWVYSAEKTLRGQPITPGFHAVTNGDWDATDDPRIQRILREMPARFDPSGSVNGWVSEAQTVCGLAGEDSQPAICVPCESGWGTVSSSVIALMDNEETARYSHAAGSPAETAFDDYSPVLQTLLDV